MELGPCADRTQALQPPVKVTRYDGDADEEECCAICFEHRTFISLPCTCHVNYCAACWDRALASSVVLRGRAQCPSCRAGFKVDYDPEKGGLVFALDKDGTASSDWRSRLYGKARPAQIRLLRNFGTAFQDCTGDSPTTSSGRGVESKEKKRMEAKQKPCFGGAGVLGHQPLCVCGAQLERVSSRGRIIRMLEDTDPAWRSRVPETEHLIDRLLHSSLVTCDLCDEVATRSGAVWTCKNGPHTVMHPAAYDVCERCFAHYVGPDVASVCGSSRREAQQDNYLNRAVGCCNSCSAAVRNVLPWHWRRQTNVSDTNAASAQSSRTRRLVGSALVGLQ